MVITMSGILAVCGAISVTGGAGFVLYRWASPAIKFKHRVDKLEVANKELTEKLEELTENTQCVCKCVLALMDSIISGNNVDNLKKVKGELEEFLIHK